MKLSTKRHITQLTFLILTIVGLFSGLDWIAIIALALLAGPVFCGWICPFGFIQDMMKKIRHHFNLCPLQVKYHHQLKSARYVLLALTLINVSAILFTLLSYDPRVGLDRLLHFNTISILNILAILTFTFLSIFVDRFFCKYLCVEGAKHSVISGGRFFKIRRSDSCIDCKKCDKTCPMGITITKDTLVNDIECINCLACIEECPVDKAIQITPAYNFNRMALSLLLSAALIATPILTSLFAPVASAQAQPTITEGTVILKGSAQGFKGTISVDVYTEDDQITSIIVTDHKDDWMWYNRAKAVITDMVANQNTDVDVVSGATYSSKGIINATKDALGESYIEVAPERGHGRRH